MALKIGKNDRFERMYMARFRGIAAGFGEFVEYERDRAARDIGLHFVSKKNNGGEIVSPSLVWFQMKGVQQDALSKAAFDSLETLNISLKVEHLRFWYIAPEPTYLTLYVEAVDRFFVLNIQKYVADNYGDKILTLDQKTLTVRISKDSVLDEQAFSLIKQRRSVEAWKSRIEEGDRFAHVFFRDAEVLRQISAAKARGNEVHLVIRKFGSKTRTEAYFYEVPTQQGAEARQFRGHWQYMMPWDISLSFPYLEFEPVEEPEGDVFWEDEDEWCEFPPLALPNGKEVKGEGEFELTEYKISVDLNRIGLAWLQTLDVMERAGFIEVEEAGGSMVSVAPWHGRDV